MSKILVTGVNGFVGKHLTRELVSQGHQVVGLGYGEPSNPEIASILSDYWSADLTQPVAVGALALDDINAVISLAGLASVTNSFGQAEAYKRVNVAVLAVLGDELLKRGLPTRVVAISTGAVYESHQPLPLTEDSQLTNNGSPYAESKLLMEAAADDLQKQGLDCVIARPFNHFGPGQATGFLLPDLYDKIINSQKSGEAVKVGNLETKRDYTDVRDVVKAYVALATTIKPDYALYNVCSGTSHKGQELVDALLEAMNLQKVTFEIDDRLMRPDDPHELRGSYDRIHHTCGWQPTITFRQSVSDFVDWKQSV